MLFRSGIWYTAVSGIWQTVWLEPVADLHTADLRAVPETDKGELTVDVALSNTATPSDAVRITARDKGKVIESTIIRGNRQGVLKIPNARLWSPDDPYLYDLTAELVKVTPPKGAGNDRTGLPPMPERAEKAYAPATATRDPSDSVKSY